MRFLIEAKPVEAEAVPDDRGQADSKGWTVTITCPRGPVPSVEGGQAGSLPVEPCNAPKPRRMGVVHAGLAGRFPAPAGCDGPGHELCRAEPGELAAAYEDIAVRREPDSAGAIARLGRYLFDALLGEPVWSAIRQAAEAAGAAVVELALAWDPTETALHRMTWELMHDGQRYLVEGCGRADVTITRVVLGADAAGRTLDRPPKLLFAIGTSPDDHEVLPGAEAISLLSNLEDRGLAVRARVLDPATPDRLEQAIANFRPDAVHFISHGELAGDDAFLALPSDERDRPGLERRDAGQLLQILRAPGAVAAGDPVDLGGALPQLVVLSACHTGPAIRLFGGHETAPLAAKLVQGGVPVVLGMAGQVSDLTSRLFARGFGRALLGGGSLVEASAEARRLGFARSDRAAPAVDWAFPAVFMSAAVDPDWRPVRPELSEEARLVNGWISRYQVDLNPVFCGRTGFLDAFWSMLRPAGERVPRVMAVCASGEAAGLGRTRLLQELARQALLAGHLPLLIGDKPGSSPRTLADFCRAVAGAVTLVRSWLGLGADASAQLNLLLRHVPGEPADERLDPTIGALLDIQREVTPQIVQLAASADLGRLAARARAKHPHVARAEGRAVLLLDDVDSTSVGLLHALHEQLLGDHGLGAQEEPVPVVLALTHGGEDNLLRDIAEGRSNRPWLVKPLRPFKPDGEDLLAYEQVMLHPWNPEARTGISNKPWVFNRSLDRPLWDDYVDEARGQLRGWPSVFTDGTLYRLIGLARIGPAPFVKDADDRALLEAFRQEVNGQ
jgi:hypothetical protein